MITHYSDNEASLATAIGCPYYLVLLYSLLLQRYTRDGLVIVFNLRVVDQLNSM